MRTVLVFTIALLAASQAAVAQQDYRAILQFDAPHAEGRLRGWSGVTPSTLHLDSVVVHGGRYAGRIERGPASESDHSMFEFSLPRTFSGRTLELRGWLRVEDVTGMAGLWLRQDGKGGPVRSYYMQNEPLRGTIDWKEYRITLPLDDATRTILLGAHLGGQGKVWVDDLELLVDGKPAADAPTFVVVKNAVELDTAFDAGSGIETQPLSPVQIANLALLGKVWGFAKYHHPRAAAGDVNWDYELFRVMPAVMQARSSVAATSSMARWLAGIGEIKPCNPCATLPTDLHLAPDTAWLYDVATLGSELSRQLVHIYRNRPSSDEQYYVSHVANVGNPKFDNEAGYAQHATPDAGYRLLSLYRFWNIIQYWFPYRDLIGEDWERVLIEFVPRMMAAADQQAYKTALLQLGARVNDTHINIWRELPKVQPPLGEAQLPVVLRFIENKAVVTDYRHAELGPASGLRIGDVIERLDGVSVDSMVAWLRPYYSASNEPTRLRDIAKGLTRGPAGPVRVSGRRATGPFELTAPRAAAGQLDLEKEWRHDRPGDAFQMLNDSVAYLKLSEVASAQAGAYIQRASKAKVLVIDIRNYPREFVVFTLGGHFVAEPTDFTRFTRARAANPGAFAWTPVLKLPPLQPRFTGSVVILIDETSQSQAEYTTMAFRSAPNAIVVGSTTAGADGNASAIPLPGGIQSMISGIGVFYPDRRPTQRVGIIPDIEVRPTIQGIREGRDEVLEAGIKAGLARAR